LSTDHPTALERPLPLSQRLAQIIDEDGPDRLSFSELAAHLHSRAWGGLLLIFAAINMLPLPPGTSAFFALPILIISAQMVFGRASPWFPTRIDRRGVTKQELRRLVGKIEWLELRVERIFKPRLARLTSPTATRGIIYRDGALVIAAAVASVLALAVDALIIGSGVVALSYAARWLGL